MSKAKGRPRKKAKRRQRNAQQSFGGKTFNIQHFFGGLLTTERAHRTARPLSTKYPIHLVLRSSQAKEGKSFWKKENARFIQYILKKISKKWGVEILNCANVGNHLHLMIKLKNRFTYEKFICGVTGAISLHLTKWNKNKGPRRPEDKFWDFRPYTRIVIGFAAKLRMQDYLDINKLEGLGNSRPEARMILDKLG